MTSSVQVNMDERSLLFFLNEKQLGKKVTLTLHGKEQAHHAPAVDLYSLNYAVEFI